MTERDRIIASLCPMERRMYRELGGHLPMSRNDLALENLNALRLSVSERHRLREIRDARILERLSKKS